MQLFFNPWLKWITIAILAYAYLGHYTSSENNKEDSALPDRLADVPISLPETDENSDSATHKIQRFIVNALTKNEQTKAFLKSAVTNAVEQKMSGQDLIVVAAQEQKRISYQDITYGEGPRASCADKISFHYEGKITGDITFIDTNSLSYPVSIVLGEGRIAPGLEAGLFNTQIGQVRQIAVPAELAYDHPNYKNDLVPKGKTVLFTVRILNILKNESNDITWTDYCRTLRQIANLEE